MNTIETQPYQFGWFDWFCLWYPPAWLILFNRHWQHYKSDPDGWNGLEYGLFLIPGGFYLALVIRWLRLGARSPRSNETEPDPTYQHAFQHEILTPILKHYFRGTLHNLDNLPPTGPLIIAMNHAGMCFPWDFVGLGLLLSQQRNWFVQPLAHPLFFDHPWLRWWLPAGWAEVLGGVRAERQSFEAAIANQTIVLYAPEGWRGLAKGWSQRYHLATFDPSFVRLSVRHRVPIVPVVCLGSESLHPFTLNVQWIAHWLKLPLFPVSPLVLAFLLFPSLGVWAARTRLQYSIQPAWCPWEEDLIGQHGDPETHRWKPDVEALQALSHTETYQLAETLRSRLQKIIEQLRH